MNQAFGTSDQVQAIRETSPVSKTLGGLRQANERQKVAIAALYDRLGPMLRTGASAGVSGASPKAVAESPFVDELDDIRAGTNANADAIEDILSRLTY